MNFDEFVSELGVIALCIVDQTAIAELRGNDLWYRTSRYGEWLFAGEIDEDVVERRRLDILREIATFNGEIAAGEVIRPGGRRLPRKVKHQPGALTATVRDERIHGLKEDVLRAAVRFCSKVDRWKGEHPDVSPLDGLRLAVRREAAFELAHTVPGEPTSEVAPLFRDDLGVTDDDIVAARKLE